VVGLWKRDEITRLWAVNTLFDEGRIVGNFSNIDRAFWTVPVATGAAPLSPLPEGPQMTLPASATDWIAARDVTAMVVLKDGRIVHESYHLGTGPDDLRISWSVAKSFLSALFGVVLEEGAIASLDDPVTRYVPQLDGTAYDGANILNVLQMASGVTFDEDYLDYNSDINRMGRVLALGGSMDAFAAGLAETEADPGARWQYVSIDTHILGMVLRGATGRSIPDLMSEKIIEPMGLEGEATYVTDGDGVAFVLGGLNMTTRDYARLGLMFAQDGRLNGRQIVPEDWANTSTTASAPTEPGATGYGYQWWMPADGAPGEYFARGIYGQYVYVNEAENVVIAVNAADRGFREAGVHDANIAVFRNIVQTLAR